jgi:hypothetical protein
VTGADVFDPGHRRVVAQLAEDDPLRSHPHGRLQQLLVAEPGIVLGVKEMDMSMPSELSPFMPK